MSEFLDDLIKRKIWDIIQKNPGIYLTKIAELLNEPISEIEKYLESLAEQRRVTKTTIDGFNQYYCVGAQNDTDAVIVETRQKIYAVIVQSPGVHQAKIAKMLGMRKSLAEYHLNYLEKTSVITGEIKNGYKRYYAVESDVATTDKQLLSLFRQTIPFEIIKQLLQTPILRHKDLAERLHISPSTLSYHLNKLIEQGIIEVQKYGEEKGYTIKKKRELILFLARYEMHTAIDSFKDIWDHIY